MAAAARKASKKKRSSSKGTFHRYFNHFTEQSEAGAEEDALVGILADLERAYSDMEEKHAALMEFYDSEEDAEDNDDGTTENKDAEVINALNTDMDKIYGELCQARNQIAVKKKERLKKEVRTGEASDRNNEAKKVKVKPLQAPSFSGNVRDYPSFKRDYNAHMKSYYGEDSFALKNCLSGEALLLVQPVDDSYEEMMKRLDFKYGRPQTLVDSVLKDLKNIKKIEDNDPKKFVQMVDIVERSYLDLKKVDQADEMNTMSMLGQFEKKLPPTRMHEWALKKQTIPPEDFTFDKFLDYLKVQRTAMEYADENVRQVPATRGTVNNTLGTVQPSEDPEEEQEEEIPSVQSQLDKIVKGLAHVAEIVASSSSSRPEGSQSPSSTRKKCYFHGSDTHNITTCTGFARLSENDRFQLVRTNRGYFCCLQIGHQGSICPDKDKQQCDKVHPTNQVSSSLVT